MPTSATAPAEVEEGVPSDHFRVTIFGVTISESKMTRTSTMTPAPLSNPTARAKPRAFAHIDTWVFDLDNTLYPHQLNLWQQVAERIRNYIAKSLDTTYDNPFRNQTHFSLLSPT